MTLRKLSALPAAFQPSFDSINGQELRSLILDDETGIIYAAGEAINTPGGALTSPDATINISGSEIEVATPNDVLKVVVNLSAAQLETLFTTPVLAIAAPGAGKMIVPIHTFVQFKPGLNTFANYAFLLGVYGSAAVAPDGALGSVVWLTGATSAQVAGGAQPQMAFNNNDTGQNWFSFGAAVWYPTEDVAEASVNQPLYIESSADLSGTSGDGTAVVTIWYTIQDVS